MVNVGVVRVRVGETLVGMLVGVRLPGRIRGTVRVLVVLVVPMRVGVPDGEVCVDVRVTLGPMQPDTENHQQAASAQPDCRRLREQDQRQDGAGESRGREVRAGPCRPQQP